MTSPFLHDQKELISLNNYMNFQKDTSKFRQYWVIFPLIWCPFTFFMRTWVEYPWIRHSILLALKLLVCMSLEFISCLLNPTCIYIVAQDTVWVHVNVYRKQFSDSYVVIRYMLYLYSYCCGKDDGISISINLFFIFCF